MCYFTFIGRWKLLTPPEVISLKRDLDRLFFSALPLFSEACENAYHEFMSACFATFGNWGDDAQLRTGYVRRRQAQAAWEPGWERMFTHAEDVHVSPGELEHLRSAYSAVLAALAKDIELLTPRDRYATANVSLNAH